MRLAVAVARTRSDPRFAVASDGDEDRARLRDSASPRAQSPAGASRVHAPFTDKCIRATAITRPMRAMDLKHHDALYNGSGGGRPGAGASVIKSEPRSISPCYSTAGNRDLQSPPSNGSAGSGPATMSASAIFNGISKRHQQRIPDEWLSPRSPTALNLPSGPSSTASNMSTSPGPSLHVGVYPSTSNGFPSPGHYDTYISASKMSKSSDGLLHSLPFLLRRPILDNHDKWITCRSPANPSNSGLAQAYLSFVVKCVKNLNFETFSTSYSQKRMEVDLRRYYNN